MLEKRAIADKMKALEISCREQGIPLTVQRRIILEELAARFDHPTPEQLYMSVVGRLPGVSRATVYRVLETLVGLGVIQRVGTCDSSSRFDAVTEAHHHIQCLSCGIVADLDDPLLSRVTVPKVKSDRFDIVGYSILFQGRCADCRADEDDPATTSHTRRKKK